MAADKNQSPYKRIVLKISGEALTGNGTFGLDPAILTRLAQEVSQIHARNVQLAIVVGGGNLFRGATLSTLGIDRVTGDHMGMLATVMNALALRDAFEKANVHTRVMSAIPMSGLVEHFDRRNAIYHLQSGHVVIFSAGTGNPLVTTDSAASLRAIEVGADILLKATNVDGVYSADPAKDSEAKLYQELTYKEVLDNELGVMDLAAFCQCRDHNLPLRVFNINKAGALLRIISGESEGTLVQKNGKVVTE